MIVLEDLSQQVSLEEKRGGFEALGAVASLSPKIQEVIDQIPVFAGTDASVLIEGETGTGKGLAAQTIHQTSKRAGYPYIKVNCGGMPESLLESELFGHARGAFETADRERQGMLRLADGGTIFFSEIGDMPLTLQAKLLSVLDEGEFSPVGSTKKVSVNVRIIAATSRDLKALVSENRFREDLYYRLNVLRLHLPPLRERAEDIPLLLDHFLKSFGPGNAAAEVEPEALRVLKDYPYPGNVRELRNVVEHAVTLSQGGKIGIQHLPEYLLQPGAGAATSPGFLTSGVNSATNDKAVKWDDVEKDMILDALRQAGGRRKDAAKILGWARSTLYRKLKYHDI
jgi:DNA-binding NtrC family response regulator